jgi:hypothetical protein
MFSRPFHGLVLAKTPDPTDESVGYYQSSATPTSHAPSLTVGLLPQHALHNPNLGALAAVDIGRKIE